MQTTIELTHGRSTLEARGEYLLVVEEGTLVSPHEVYRYVTELEQASQRLKIRRILIDARSESGEETPDTRAAMWRWIRTQRHFDSVAYVLRDEMTIARVNMTSLSERLNVRAFPGVPEAHRWLIRGALRQSSTSIPSMGRSSSVPPPATTPSVLPRSSGTPTQRLRAITGLDLEGAMPTPTPAPPSATPTPGPITRSHATLKTPTVDAESAEEILRKRR